jgi:uncharacterized protein (DUF1499 family)
MRLRHVIWLLPLLLVLGFAAYVRLAPSDPARWHVAIADPAAPDCTVTATEGAARYACRMPGTPAEVLARLDSIALAQPRTTRLAGSAETGRITWVTRSALWGFPDYTTAEARAEEGQTRLDLHARLRFGRGDMGVNAARLADWTAALRG